MAAIPRAALVLGLAGTLPFIFGAVLSVFPNLASAMNIAPVFVARLIGHSILLTYGIVILSFMTGVLWGFATQAEDETSSRFYVLSVVPAILAFFYAVFAFISPLSGLGPVSLLPLIAGFLGLLGLDQIFSRSGLTPNWWMSLRTLLTFVVVVCLGIGSLTV